MSWRNESYRHSLARKGVKSSPIKRTIFYKNPKNYKSSPIYARLPGLHEYTKVRKTQNDWRYYELDTHEFSFDNAVFHANDKYNNEVYIINTTKGYELKVRKHDGVEHHVERSNNYSKLRSESFRIISRIDKFEKWKK